MKQENQCSTLEQSKRLKELGVIAPANFRHYQSSVGVVFLNTIEGEPYLDNEWYAYSASELAACLGVLAPSWTVMCHEWANHVKFRIGKTMFTTYRYFAHTAAAALIEFLEKGDISAEECNSIISAE